MKIIAHISTDFREKFGIPRQSGLADTAARIVFEPEYRVKEALRGIEGFSHLWLIWKFSECERETWSPTVRPPKLGGNTRMGVFATRSPFRPNPIGLSSVRLLSVDYGCDDAPALLVAGADLLDGTPLYDIKPYLAYTDSHPEATGGFALEQKEGSLFVVFPPDLQEKIPIKIRKSISEVLAQDPRPAYQEDPNRIYGMRFADYEIKFRVEGNTLTVLSIT